MSVIGVMRCRAILYGALPESCGCPQCLRDLREAGRPREDLRRVQGEYLEERQR